MAMVWDDDQNAEFSSVLRSPDFSQAKLFPRDRREDGAACTAPWRLVADPVGTASTLLGVILLGVSEGYCFAVTKKKSHVGQTTDRSELDDLSGEDPHGQLMVPSGSRTTCMISQNVSRVGYVLSLCVQRSCTTYQNGSYRIYSTKVI